MRSGQTQQVPETLFYYLVGNIAQVHHLTAVYSKEFYGEICAKVTIIVVESDSIYWQLAK